MWEEVAIRLFRGFSGGMNSPLGGRWPRVRLRGRAVLRSVDRDYPAPIPPVSTLIVENERRCLADPPNPPAPLAPSAPPPTSGGMNSPLWPRVRLRGRAVLMWVGRDYSAPIPPAPTLFVENERSRPSYPPSSASSPSSTSSSTHQRGNESHHTTQPKACSSSLSVYVRFDILSTLDFPFFGST